MVINDESNENNSPEINENEKSHDSSQQEPRANRKSSLNTVSYSTPNNSNTNSISQAKCVSNAPTLSQIPLLATNDAQSNYFAFTNFSTASTLSQPPPLDSNDVQSNHFVFLTASSTPALPQTPLLASNDAHSDYFSFTDDSNQDLTKTPSSGPTRNKSCQFCGKKFYLQNELKRHEMIHTNSRPFVCTWPRCTRRTLHKFQIIKHIRTVHFKLPVTRKQQLKMNIHDDRDPKTFFTFNPAHIHPAHLD